MARTQVRLGDAQIRTLRKLSASTGKTIARLVQQAVDLPLRTQLRQSRETRARSALEVSGSFASGRTDISVEHDRYLAETFGSRSSSEN